MLIFCKIIWAGDMLNNHWPFLQKYCIFPVYSQHVFVHDTERENQKWSRFGGKVCFYLVPQWKRQASGINGDDSTLFPDCSVPEYSLSLLLPSDSGRLITQFPKSTEKKPSTVFCFSFPPTNRAINKTFREKNHCSRASIYITLTKWASLYFEHLI